MSDIPNPEPRTEEQPETVTPPQPVSEPTVPPATTAPTEPPIDYEKKFSESTRENQVLQAQLEAERAKNARRELTNEPTDSELQAAFPEWEYMSDTEKKLARKSFNAERTARQLAEERQAEKAEQSWNRELDIAIAAHPDLEGKEVAFKEYAKKPTHRGAPVEVLVDAFLRRSSATPAPVTTPEPGLEPGTGGPKTSERPKVLSATELKTLRETDEKAWREYISTHDISDILD